ncbi:hypothetical protein RSOLAG1IB_05172 [Rhizoctonia solani AG-1 IB]|uniref:Ribosomal RNA methyltransferase FtsJ domain-containing protein n=1 Tax=Thanatephorus cucumeris (strain AG1-IB / isolate 7/3/14) TaxID=1108050 RepID=A0A0B7G3W1_THACB|nr:hypothetical protein RSOLAG1IB_05172 [Rhizoctonia solani AG-1 IB]
MSFPSSKPAPDAAAGAEALWLTEALLGRRDCDTFRKLEDLRHHIRMMGITPRPRPRPPSPAGHERLTRCADVMYQVFESMHQDSDPYSFARRTGWFLDIGSNPGGFARYLLEHSPRARGVGVTLPVDEGGIGRAVPPSDRFELRELNLLDLVSRYMTSGTLPFTRTIFDSIILDADKSSPRILIAQLLLALSTIHDGGQILLTLSCIERPLAARILIAFSKVADYISLSTPSQVQTWDIFYVHAQVVRVNTPAYRKLKDNLERLWNQIHSTHTRDPKWHEEDLITPWEEVMKKSSMDLIAKLGNPVWGTQLTALHRAFEADVNQTD